MFVSVVWLPADVSHWVRKPLIAIPPTRRLNLLALISWYKRIHGTRLGRVEARLKHDPRELCLSDLICPAGPLLPLSAASVFFQAVLQTPVFFFLFVFFVLMGPFEA